MSPELEKFLYASLGALVTAILGALGYLAKRRLEKKPQFDALEKHSKLLAIKKQFSEQNISVEELHEFEQTLLAKKMAVEKHTKQIQEVLTPELEAIESDDDDGDFLTTYEAKGRAQARLEVAQLKLRHVYVELLDKLSNDGESDEEVEALKQAQQAWEEYSEKQADAGSIGYRMGTAYSLFYMAELESLVVERIALLQSKIDELKAM
jgi:uncharacterized protein YecT (DUF1311 family)